MLSLLQWLSRTASTDEQTEQSRNTLIEMTKMLGAMVVSLQKRTNKRQEDSLQSDDTIKDDTPVSNSSDSDFNLNFNY